MPMTFLTRNVWRDDGRNRSHVPAMPVWIGIVRIFQIILAIATLALTAYGITTMQKAVGYGRITNWSGSEGYPFSWFVFAWTFSYLVWLLVAVMYIPIMYNPWVHLGLELLTLIFWMIAMALLASHSDDLDSIDAYVTSLGPSFKKYYQDFIQRYARGFVDATFAATGVATANFLLFCLTIFKFGRALHHQREEQQAAIKTNNSQQTIPASDTDKIVISPQPVPAYYQWNNQLPPNHPYSMYAAAAAAAAAAGTPFPPPSSPTHPQHYPQNVQPAYFPPGTYPSPNDTTASPAIWPQQNYGMYQQQVPIAAHHTGDGQGFGSPIYPMVSPVAPTKTDLTGARTTPTEPSLVPTGPQELNESGHMEGNMPAELPHNPPRSPR